jgi:hypothetical protein
VTEWKNDYPWLQLAFKHVGRSGRKASEAWRTRIENGLDATLDYKLRPDGTVTVWCGLSGHDFHHEPTPKELLEGLADAYRREAERLGVRLDSVVVVTREGPVEVTSAGRDVLVEEIRGRGSDDDVALTLETAGGAGQSTSAAKARSSSSTRSGRWPTGPGPTSRSTHSSACCGRG